SWSTRAWTTCDDTWVSRRRHEARLGDVQNYRGTRYMTHADDTPSFDPEAVRDKYAEERAKRMTEDRGVLYDLRADERFREYTKDPFTPFAERDALVETVDVAIIGAGMSGVTVGAKLGEQGLRKIVLIDKAGGIGG